MQFDDREELVVTGVLNFDDMEKFYKQSYENGLKEFISDDYEYCIWYVLNEDCELTCHIKVSDVEILRELTKEDDAEYGKNLENFKKIHKFYEFEKKFEDEEKDEKKAKEEFDKSEKVKFKVLVKEGNQEVDAIIYKGFAIHSSLTDIDSSFKTISIAEGEHAGKALTSCSVAKYKNLIDEI